MGAFDYSENKTKALVTFQAHKFPYTASVYYQCNVKLCLKASGGCDDVPPNCDPQLNSGLVSRKRRDVGTVRDLDALDADVRDMNIEVYSGLYVNEPADSEPEGMLCQLGVVSILPVNSGFVPPESSTISI